MPHTRGRGLFRRRPLTADSLRALDEARRSKERLVNVKVGKRSIDRPAEHQHGAPLYTTQRVGEESVATETPQQKERETFGTEL